MANTVRTNWDTLTNRDILRGGLRKEFDSTLKSEEVVYPSMFNDLKTDKYIERDVRMAGLPLAQAVVEGANIPIGGPKLDTIKEYTQSKFGSGYRITFEMKKFNKINLVKKLNTSLAKAQRTTKDIEAHKLWNSPTATYTGYDTLHLGEAAHTCLDDSASTYDNIYSAAMSVTGIQSGLYYFKKLKNDQGQTISLRPDTLYFEPTQMFTADELLGSSRMPHEMSNTKNSISKFGLTQLPNIRITSTTAWGMLAKKDELFDVNIFTSSSPDHEMKDAPDTTRDTIVTSQQLFIWGFGDPRAVWIGNV